MDRETRNRIRQEQSAKRAEEKKKLGISVTTSTSTTKTTKSCNSCSRK